MKRNDQLYKEIILEKSHKRELDKLKELQLCERLASQWLKDKFGEKYESSGESRWEGENSKEIINIRVTTKGKDLAATSEEVAGESTLAAPVDVKYDIRLDTICPPIETHQVK